jgi:hypothetical protein
VQNYNLLRIKGRTDLHVRLEIFKYIITVIAIALTYKHGIIALIYGQITVAVISHFVVSYFVGRLVDYTLFDQLKALFPQGIISLIMGGSIYYVGNLLNTDSNLIIFSTQIVLGLVIYFLLNKLIKAPELEEFLSIIGNFTKTLLSKLKGKR